MFSKENLEQFLRDELRTAHPSVELSCTPVEKPGTAIEWVVEISAPVYVIRVFRPSSKGQRAHARVLAAEIAHTIDEYLASKDG
jgi:hypothetical protein